MTIRTYSKKRAFLSVIAMLLAFGMLGTLPAADAAAEAGTRVTVESVEAGAGDTVTVYVKISGNSGISNFDFAAAYDDGLQLTGIISKDCLCAKGYLVPNLEKGYVIWASASNVTAPEGNLFGLTFQVDENAAPGDYQISVGLKDGGACGNENGSVAVTFVDGRITVEGMPSGPSADDPPGNGQGAVPPSGSGGNVTGTGNQSTGNESTDVPAAPVEITFSDVAEHDWYYDCVWSMAAAGVVKGYPDHTFRPMSNVTCAEALKLILLASGYDLADSGTGHWAENYYNFALRAGLVKSDAELDEPIARIDIAHIIAGAEEITGDNGPSPFLDTDDALVTALYNVGLLKGYGNGNFGPNEMLTRAELTMIVWRLYSYTGTGTIPE